MCRFQETKGAKMLRGPRPDGLGSLSAWYESGKRGTSAVGWDEGGGSSYGKYQLAYIPGTLKKFLLWCTVPFPSLYSALWPLYGSAGNRPSTANPSAFMAKWLELAKGQDLPKAEHEFIAISHYDPAYSGMGENPRRMVDKYRAIQDVLWSTAVQHGPGAATASRGAVAIFNNSYREGNTAEEFIDAVYTERGKYLGKLKQATRAAVLNRYNSEKKRAKGMLAASTPATTPTSAPSNPNIPPGPLDQVRADIQNGGKK